MLLSHAFACPIEFVREHLLGGGDTKLVGFADFDRLDQSLLGTLAVDATRWLGTARPSVGQRLPIEGDRLLLCCLGFTLGLLRGEQVILGLSHGRQRLPHSLGCRDLWHVPGHRGRSVRWTGITIRFSLFGIAAIRYRSRRSQSFKLVRRWRIGLAPAP